MKIIGYGVGMKYITRVYRFQDLVAISVDEGRMIYFTPKEAKQLARALNKGAKSVLTEEFVAPNFGVVDILKEKE